MDFNLTTNIESCFNLIRDTVNLPFVYYSHIPSALISLVIGLLILLKNRTLLGKILFSISVLFSIWVVSSLITWTSTSSLNYMFFWSLFGLVTASIFILSIYFSHVFLFKKDVSVMVKYFFTVLTLPVFLYTPTVYNLNSFDAVWCVPNENTPFLTYYYSFGAIAVMSVLYLLYKKIRQSENKAVIKEAVVFTTGILLFIAMFLFTGFFASYLTDVGITATYDLELYGLFGMVIFMAFLGYLIVKFKAFNIKLIGAQALVWALIALVGSEFLFVESVTAQILVAITLVLSAIVGLIIVRSVKKEIAQREELDMANKNQQLLIRFITHQVKGFFTKSKMVFATILEGDLGEISAAMKELIKQGMESDNKAVDMVQEVLNAASLRDGRMAYNFEDLDLGSFVKSVADSFAEVAKQKNLQYEVVVPSVPLMVKFDKLQMSQVFKNLIDNAIKYTLDGHVRISLEKRGNIAHFVINDSGVGLSDSDKAKLFKEGGRGEESLKFNVNSTGYGLFIVKKIVEGHNGKIWATSAGRGHGSQFFVEIPSL